MTSRLRITGGSRRGRKLVSPPANSIRPASDFIRQAVFNMLGDAVEGCVFYDVFAGTGIVGLEALSRGAARAIFVEKDRRQIELIRRNVQHANFVAEARIRTSDAHVWATHFVREGDRAIVFLGPPYPDFQPDLDRLLAMVATVQSQLVAGDYLVLQFPRVVHPEKLPDADHWYRMRHYGKSRVGIWRPDSGEDDDRDEQADDADEDVSEIDRDDGADDE